MKRIISLVLAFSMLLALAPAAVAEETQQESAIPGITIKYDISAMIDNAGEIHGAESFGGKGYRGIDYDRTNGFFEYAANKTNGKYSWNEDGINHDTYVAGVTSGTTRVRLTPGTGRNGLMMKASAGNWWALKIYVPASGVYTPKVTYWAFNKKEETYLDYFLIKNDGSDISELLKEENLTTESLGYIGSKRSELYDEDSKKGQTYMWDEAFPGTVSLEKGEYYLVYKSRVVTGTGKDNYGVCSNFTLDGGSTNDPVPMYTRVVSDSEKIYAGGGITQVSADVYMSDGTVEKGDNVELTSRTPDYVSVNDVFNVVVGKSVGTAKLSAVVTHKGETLAETELEIPVVENPLQPGNGEKIIYDVSSRINKEPELNGKNGVKYTDLTYDTTGNLWEYAANRTHGAYSWNEDGWNHTTNTVSKEEGGGGYTRLRIANSPMCSGLQMTTNSNTWFAIKLMVPYTGIYLPSSTYWQYGGKGEGAESYLDYYLIKNDGSDIETLLTEDNLTKTSKYYIGSKRNEDNTLASSQNYILDEPFENKVSLEEGEYYLVYKPRYIKGDYNHAFASNFMLDGVNCVKDIYISAETDINWNEEEKISVLPIRLDGTAISEEQYTVTYTSSNELVAKVSKDGVVKGTGEGNADISVTVSDGIGKATKKISFTVTDTTGMSDIIYNLDERLYVNQRLLLDIDAVMNSGNILDIPDEYISYSYSPEGVITINDGIMTALAEGEVTVATEVDFRGKKITCENKITVIPDDGKTEPNIYTYEMRENAKKNVAKYDWAKKQRDNAMKNADQIVADTEQIRYHIMGEGIPRGRQLGSKGDDYYRYCRYCHADVDGEYSWSYDFVNRPWKVQCSACKRLFPSNNFAGFYELGRDQQGYFDVDRARQAHHEMLFHEDGSECGCEKPKTANTPEWYIFYGYGNPKGYLYNELYSEIRDSNTDPWGDKITWNDENGGADLGTYTDENGKVLWKGGDMWAVDDGWGYLPGREYEDGLAERLGYISLYAFNFYLDIHGKLNDLGDAYLYSGDPKYGRAGALILDRIADVWKNFDAYYFKDQFFNSSGGNGMGAAVGKITDHELGRDFCYAVDVFYPMITDETVIRTLAADAERYGLENKKMSSEDIWRNWADGICIASADMCMDGRINGNYGQAQAVAAIASIALHEQPKTDDIIRWIYKSGQTESDRTVSGGNFEDKMMSDVDRDGMGNESSPRYNTSWVRTLRTMADALLGYDGEKNYNPYENPKFVKMYDPQMEMLLTNSKHPNVGDSGSPASITLTGTTSVWYNGFTQIKNEAYRKKIAQYLYEVTDGDLEDLGLDIFAENPESAEDELMSYVDENKKAESRMLTGYGIAILRDGANYKSASASTASNTQRDFWMWFGNLAASHGHQDALNIGIDAFGLDVAPDLGYPEDTSYTPNRLQWVDTTLSHNTIVVDEKQQVEAERIHGDPIHFDDSGRVKLMDVDMKDAYPQTENYRRTVVMVQASDEVAYGVDFFRVTGGDHHLFSFHSQAENAYPIAGLSLTPDSVVQDANGKDIVGSYAGADAPFGNDPNTQNAWVYETFYPRGYTWLKNVRRDASPEAQFTVEFDVQDYRKVLSDGKGIKLRMTQFNNFTPNEVAIAGGYVPQKSDTGMMPETLDYVLVEREGENLDSLFTTVYEPYRNTPYIAEIKPIDISRKTGTEEDGDIARAVRVKHTEESGGNTDYIVYATNKDVVYTITDGERSFDFSGFVGVYTVNANGGVIYRYVNDGTIIGEETGKTAAYTGTVTGFQTENAFENYIDAEIDCADLDDLAGKYIYVNNDGVQNAAYQIISATDSAEGLEEGSVRLDIGTVTLIRGHKDKNDLDKGYVYNIKEGQTFSVPTSFVDESVPEFESVPDGLSVSAGSSISVSISAKSPIETDAPTITYVAATLPRGASLNAETGVLTWKPDSSQVGENHVAITARDSDGREATIHFDIAVYGSTTGSSGQGAADTTQDSSAAENTSSSGTAGGGGGGASGSSTSAGNADSDTSDETENADTAQPDVGLGSSDEPKFTDLGNHSWAEDAINSLADAGIVRGTAATTYSPAANITRADFALLLVRAFNLTSDNTENFADVSAGDYFASELAIARNTGIVNGIGDNKYAPRNTITRQDMMVIVYRAITTLGKMPPFSRGRGTVEDGGGILPSQSLAATALPEGEPSEAEEYPDWDNVAPYARDAVSALIGAGLVNGKSGCIAPSDYTTRAEVAVLIKRILDYTREE